MKSIAGWVAVARFGNSMGLVKFSRVTAWNVGEYSDPRDLNKKVFRIQAQVGSEGWFVVDGEESYSTYEAAAANLPLLVTSLKDEAKGARRS